MSGTRNNEMNMEKISTDVEETLDDEVKYVLKRKIICFFPFISWHCLIVYSGSPGESFSWGELGVDLF